MDKQSPHLFLRAPTPARRGLSFCDASPREMKRWIAGLPKANIGETARQLYQGLIELNQLITPADNRLQLLELLRPEVHFVCNHLERHFLNQSIVLDERPRKVANLCQALQSHLASGYKQIIVEELPRFAKERPQLLTVALQRASHSLCAPLVRASQLYCPVPEGLWLELHQLHRLARQHGLQRVQVRDNLARNGQSLSQEQVYIGALLLGCARCNQLRQNGIARLAEALEHWSSLASLQPADEPHSLFVIAPQLDGRCSARRNCTTCWASTRMSWSMPSRNTSCCRRRSSPRIACRCPRACRRSCCSIWPRPGATSPSAPSSAPRGAAT